MLLIRSTKSLATRVGIKKLADTERASTTTLGDWYATDFTISRQQLILCVSQNARLPIVLEAAPYKLFPERLIEMLGQVLRAIEVPEESIERELSAMNERSFAKTVDRSLVGTLNQFSKDLECAALYGSCPPRTFLESSLFLADGICMALPEKVPADAARKLFLKMPLHLVH